MLNFLKQRHNATFYITAVSQVLVVVQLIMAGLGHANALTDAVQHRILAIVDLFVLILASFGVINDPTGASKKALMNEAGKANLGQLVKEIAPVVKEVEQAVVQPVEQVVDTVEQSTQGLQK